VRRSVRRGLAEAIAEVEQANDAIKAFGSGYDAGFGMENGAGGRNSLSTKEKFVIAQQVGRSRKLRQIAAVCGRFTRIALQQQKTRVKYPPDEITSITATCEAIYQRSKRSSLLFDSNRCRVWAELKWLNRSPATGARRRHIERSHHFNLARKRSS
jgi:hypothetical protein